MTKQSQTIARNVIKIAAVSSTVCLATVGGGPWGALCATFVAGDIANGIDRIANHCFPQAPEPTTAAE